MFASKAGLLDFYERYFRVLNAVLEPMGPSFGTFREFLERPGAIVVDRKRAIKEYRLVLPSDKWQCLRFQTSIPPRHPAIRLDIYFDIHWRNDPTDPYHPGSSYKARVGTADPDYLWREEWDAERLIECEERVIIRFHWDRKNAGQPGPRYHVQYGGQATGEEYYWPPEPFHLPRWPSPPVDLVLITDFLLAQFYPDEWLRLKDDSAWRSLVRDSEDFYYRPYANALAQHFRSHDGSAWWDLEVGKHSERQIGFAFGP